MSKIYVLNMKLKFSLNKNLLSIQLISHLFFGDKCLKFDFANIFLHDYIILNIKQHKINITNGGNNKNFINDKQIINLNSFLCITLPQPSH